MLTADFLPAREELFGSAAGSSASMIARLYACALVVVGVAPTAQELVVLADGYRESTEC